MEIYFGYVIKTVLLPPAGNFLGLVVGWLIWNRARLLGRLVFWLSLLSLIALCIPAVAGLIATATERYPALPPTDLATIGPGTIVILAGGRDIDRAEYGGETLSATTLQRLRYGAFVAKRSNLPVAVSGGTVYGEGSSEAALMAQALENEFAVDVSVVEGRSRNTAENARYTAELVDSKRIILVTHSMHMWRAAHMFTEQGFEVIPAPLALQGLDEFPTELFDWLPAAYALAVSRYGLHEWLGMAWYAIRY